MAEMRALASRLRFPEPPVATPDGLLVPGAELRVLNP